MKVLLHLGKTPLPTTNNARWYFDEILRPGCGTHTSLQLHKPPRLVNASG